MEVLCINANGFLASDEYCEHVSEFEVKNGKIYTVFDAFVEDGYCWYVLKEDTSNDWENDETYGWEASRFISNHVVIDSVKKANKPRKKTWLGKLVGKLIYK